MNLNWFRKGIEQAPTTLKTWNQIRDELDPDGTKHDLTLICDRCGNSQTCRCPKPKRKVHGICMNCAEKEKRA